LILTLVRHGETLWNKENRIQGHTDIELNDHGRMQVHKLALSLKGAKIDAIVASPLKRAYETAEVIANFHHINIQIDRNLQELDHGDFESLTIQQLKETHGDFLKAWVDNPSYLRMPNGESLLEVQQRTWTVIKGIIESSKNTLIVSHGMAIMAILCKIQNLSLSTARQMFVNMASKTIVEFSNGQGDIKLFNDTSHLED